MMVTGKEYQEHHVFLELNCYIEFYESLSHSIFSFISSGTHAICNIDTYVYSSIKGTLESIKHILGTGRINDAYALLRKFYDSAVINVYSNLYLSDKFSIKNFVVEQIDNWVKGKDQFPDFRVMSNYIRSSNKLSDISDLLYSDDRYKKIRARCNDHTHYNFFYNVLLNDNEVHLQNRIQSLNTLSSDIRDVFILHLAYLFYLNEHYMTSSDYLDSLECGMSPEPDSQFWVAPFIQQIFDNIITKHRNDIVLAIKQKTCMQLT
jgi:hypothetical protein